MSATFVHCKDNSSAPATLLKSLDDDEHVDQHTCNFTCVVYIGKVRYKPATSSTVNASDTCLIRVSHAPISRVSTHVHARPRVQFDLTRA